MDNNWNYNPNDEIKKPENERNKELLTELAAVDKALEELVDEGLTGDDLLCVWVERRISPLQKRSCSIWQMSGPMDPNRMSTFVLTKDSIFRRIKAISSTTTLKVDWNYGKEPYSRDHPPPSVCIQMMLISY